MIENMKWTREPKDYNITNDRIDIITDSHTDACVPYVGRCRKIHEGQQPDC